MKQIKIKLPYKVEEQYEVSAGADVEVTMTKCRIDDEYIEKIMPILKKYRKPYKYPVEFSIDPEIKVLVDDYLKSGATITIANDDIIERLYENGETEKIERMMTEFKNYQSTLIKTLITAEHKGECTDVTNEFETYIDKNKVDEFEKELKKIGIDIKLNEK